MTSGRVSLILHAHLPLCSHPDERLEPREVWLFEAILESYLPLLGVLHDLETRDIPGRLTLSVSPPLLEMLGDERLCDKFDAYLDAHIELCERVRDREPLAAADFLHDRALQMRSIWHDIDRDLAAAWRALDESGRIELGICAGTHALLPLMLTDECRRAHLDYSVRIFEETFGRPPRFLWLPECAFTPGLETLLGETGVWCTVVEGRAIAEASAAPVYGNYAPLIAGDVAFFGRDPESGAQVWSSRVGYPGDESYREFHRDELWEYPADQTPAFTTEDQTRVPSAVKIHRVTGPDVDLADKELWDPDRAMQRAREHAAHFVAGRASDVRDGFEAAERPVHLTCPYDAELFGHWWYEGPEFLRAVFEIAAEQHEFELSTPVDYLRDGPVLQHAVPGESTWGANSDFSWWVDEATAWLIPALHAAETRWVEQGQGNADATRELMLAQSSDWPFAIRGVTHAGYATRRVLDHLRRFHDLLDVADRS